MLERAGIAEADTVIVATSGDNTNIVVSQVAKERYGVEAVGVRLLDPARAAFYGNRGLHVVSPTRDAIDSLAKWALEEGDLMFLLVVGGGKVGLERGADAAGLRHEVVLIEQNRESLRETRGGVRARGDPRRRHRAPRPRAGRDGPPAGRGRCRDR